MILPAGKHSGKGEKKRGEGRETRNPGHTHSSMCDVYKYKLSHICYKEPQNEKKKSSALEGEVPIYERTAFSSLERCGTPPGQTKHISLIRGRQDKFVITVSVSSFLPPKTYPATAGENKSSGGGGRAQGTSSHIFPVRCTLPLPPALTPILTPWSLSAGSAAGLC